MQSPRLILLNMLIKHLLEGKLIRHSPPQCPPPCAALPDFEPAPF